MSAFYVQNCEKSRKKSTSFCARLRQKKRFSYRFYLPLNPPLYRLHNAKNQPIIQNKEPLPQPSKYVVLYNLAYIKSTSKFDFLKDGKLLVVVNITSPTLHFLGSTHKTRVCHSMLIWSVYTVNNNTMTSAQSFRSKYHNIIVIENVFPKFNKNTWSTRARKLGVCVVSNTLFLAS